MPLLFSFGLTIDNIGCKWEEIIVNIADFSVPWWILAIGSKSNELKNLVKDWSLGFLFASLLWASPLSKPFKSVLKMILWCFPLRRYTPLFVSSVTDLFRGCYEGLLGQSVSTVSVRRSEGLFPKHDLVNLAIDGMNTSVYEIRFCACPLHHVGMRHRARKRVAWHQVGVRALNIFYRGHSDIDI